MNKISLGREEFSLKYQTSLSIEKGMSQDEVKELYQKQFEAVQKRELEQASTLVGPHRDDLIFYLMINLFKILVLKGNNVQLY